MPMGELLQQGLYNLEKIRGSEEKLKYCGNLGLRLWVSLPCPGGSPDNTGLTLEPSIRLAVPDAG